VLAQAAAATGQAGYEDAARRAFTAERARFEPGRGWHAGSAHPWAPAAEGPDATWCRGAAGIGLARLTAHATLGDLVLLAEAGAAVELVRRHLATRGHRDASLCHGEAGAIELLLSAGLLLGEQAHLGAARTAGHALTERASPRGRYEGAFGAPARNPSMFFGLAGIGTLLLRLPEPGALPTLALPPLART
jgi:lantibiotic modifying enzyme